MTSLPSPKRLRAGRCASNESSFQDEWAVKIPLLHLRPLTEKNGVTWVDPSLQIEVTYFEETEGGHFRFPVFKRILE
jgi:hypothetical protein